VTQETVLGLPADLRGELKAPLGPVFTDAEALLADAGRPLLAVGDVVTYHLAAAGATLDLAVVDGQTERETVTEEVRAGLPALDCRVEVSNEAATLSAALVSALVDAVASDETVLVVVDGEEDLAALPLFLLAPEGATVVYGQPGEGMVRATVTAERRTSVRALLERMETTDEFWALVDRTAP